MKSFTWTNILLNTFERVWGISASRAETRGNPAPTRVANCRVIMVRSDGFTRENSAVNVVGLPLAAFSGEATDSFMLVGYVRDDLSF